MSTLVCTCNCSLYSSVYMCMCMYMCVCVFSQYMRKLYSFNKISMGSRGSITSEEATYSCLPLTLVSASSVGPSGVRVVLAESACGVYV